MCILVHKKASSVCLLQRPETGLLANLYELPSMKMEAASAEDQPVAWKGEKVQQQLQLQFGCKVLGKPKVSFDKEFRKFRQ